MTKIKCFNSRRNTSYPRSKKITFNQRTIFLRLLVLEKNAKEDAWWEISYIEIKLCWCGSRNLNLALHEWYAFNEWNSNNFSNGIQTKCFKSVEFSPNVIPISPFVEEKNYFATFFNKVFFTAYQIGLILNYFRFIIFSINEKKSFTFETFYQNPHN